MTNLAQLERDYTYCESIIKENSKSFYFTFKQLPKEKAKAVFAIYTFCRFADDRADQHAPANKRLHEVDQLEHDLSLFQKGYVIDQPMWRALRDVFQRYEMDIQPFFDQIKGQRMDIAFERLETVEDVEQYSYYVAGTVGLMLLPIIASETDRDLTSQAISLGIGMQFTNILRDIGEDYREMSRVYLPVQEMNRFAYTIEDLSTSTINDNFIMLWEQMAARAESRYDEFMSELHHFDADSQLPVGYASTVYRAILNAVRDNDYQCFTTRNYVRKEEMIRLTGELSLETVQSES
ncbi:phytoene synthase [Geomicrobium sp. JCM 19037]|uniref:phytoene/squalene synthase family protein n=1 Tax=unclassified Geomicrobium TaxID=2628951 RepID=UPI00045F2B6C|nr:phytoene/squalene synthase family protein [Geomicrobium sp. JCM 19037]GAK01890.1 phytoene synthase [Geomicrobium sp. JCM 19037]